MGFSHYLIRRFGMTMVTLAGILSITFILARIIPADPVAVILGPQAPPELLENTYHELGFDQPLYTQFVIYWENVLHGNLGISLRTQRPVLEDLCKFFPVTIELATIALLIGVFTGIPLGILCAVKKDTWGDHLARIVSLFGLSMPVFWSGLMALLIFYYWLEWLPGPGQLSPYLFPDESITGLLLVDSLLHRNFEIFFDALQHLVLPSFVLGYFATASITRITRSSMLEVMNQDYIQTARAKGVRESVVVYSHALKNAIIPITTVIGLMYGNLLEGAVLTETIFSWPGLGRYMTDAILSLDFNAVMGGTMLIALVFLITNFVVDMLYALLNPQIRYK